MFIISTFFFVLSTNSIFFKIRLTFHNSSCDISAKKMIEKDKIHI